jgi:hypothetical protein
MDCFVLTNKAADRPVFTKKAADRLVLTNNAMNKSNKTADRPVLTNKAEESSIMLASRTRQTLTYEAEVNFGSINQAVNSVCVCLSRQ